MATALYIYYRIDGNILPIRQDVTELMAEVFQKAGIQGRLLQRRDDAKTWMEIYEPVKDNAGLSLALQNALATRPMLAAIQRHEEWFVTQESEISI